MIALLSLTNWPPIGHSPLGIGITVWAFASIGIVGAYSLWTESRSN